MEKSQGGTLRIKLDGVEYELDVSHTNAQKLRDDFGEWLDHARKVCGQRHSRRTTSDVDNRAVRAWAASKGMEVSKRGRIPADIVQQFKAAADILKEANRKNTSNAGH